LYKRAIKVRIDVVTEVDNAVYVASQACPL
jgi:hypothetical protein